MEKPVHRPLVERTVLDVFAEDAGALLVAAAEEPTASVLVRRRTALMLMLMPMRHRGSLLSCRRSGSEGDIDDLG
jgi:hypothetical protein